MIGLNTDLKYSRLGLTERWESCRLWSTWDAVGNRWQIGWCHTGPEVHVGQQITQERANELLMHDTMVAQSTIWNFVKVRLNQEEFDALVDFIYNVGSGAFINSTLLEMLNRGDFANAANQFARWDKAAGKVVQGLLNRRLNEQALFEKGIKSEQSNSPSPVAGLTQVVDNMVQRGDGNSAGGGSGVTGSMATAPTIPGSADTKNSGDDSGGGEHNPPNKDI